MLRGLLLSSSSTASQPQTSSYDAFSEKYDDLDGGYVASYLKIPEMRQHLVSLAKGDTLEVAAGTGLNAPYYDGIDSLTLLDSSPGMLAKARSRASSAKVVVGDAEALPFADSSFDTVVSTFSLCVFDKPLVALKEMRRVVRPRGRVLLLENTRPENKLAAAYVDATADFVSKNGGKGCRYDTNVPDLIKQAQFSVDSTNPYLAGFFRAFVLSPN